MAASGDRPPWVPDRIRYAREFGESSCDDSCPYSGDGECDDGGPGADHSLCLVGADCTDCGERSGVNEFDACDESCRFNNDGECDDGGPGSEFSLCIFGLDCTDCGVRNPSVNIGEEEEQSTCKPRESFVQIGFAQATLVRSNIGGQGGRCWLEGECQFTVAPKDPNDALELPGSNTDHEMYITNIGINSMDPKYSVDGVSSGNGEQVDLVVTNLTEYRSWNTNWNWVKNIDSVLSDSKLTDAEVELIRSELGNGVGSQASGYPGAQYLGGGFVGTNLAGARTADQTGLTSGWSTTFTFCEFLYEFVTTGANGIRVPLTLPRTYVSFYVRLPTTTPHACSHTHTHTHAYNISIADPRGDCCIASICMDMSTPPMHCQANPLCMHAPNPQPNPGL